MTNGKRATQRERAERAIRAERAVREAANARVLREAMEPDNRPYLRDRCREFLEKQKGRLLASEKLIQQCAGPYDEDTDALVKFVVEELYRAGAIS